MRNFLYIILFTALCGILIYSCNAPKFIGLEVVDSITSEKTVSYQDTTLGVESDSSYYQAYIDCDSNGRAYLREIETLKKGKRARLNVIKLAHTPEETNLLSLGVVCDSMEIYFAMAERFEKVEQTKIKTITKTLEVNKLTWWQQTQVYGFWILAALFLLIAILKYFKII